MKPLFSKEYYESRWDEFLQPVGTGWREHYVNLEADLERQMAVYENLGIDEKGLDVIRKMEAQKIADNCRVLVLKERDIVKRIENGESTFGLPKAQEIRQRADFRKRFEFNCLQMRKFKEKYNLQ